MKAAKEHPASTCTVDLKALSFSAGLQEIKPTENAVNVLVGQAMERHEFRYGLNVPLHSQWPELTAKAADEHGQPSHMLWTIAIVEIDVHATLKSGDVQLPGKIPGCARESHNHSRGLPIFV